ncbi:MAG: hypothetical protein WD049_01130, partial [Candidatus Paceibacterota bacterium]
SEASRRGRIKMGTGVISADYPRPLFDSSPFVRLPRKILDCRFSRRGPYRIRCTVTDGVRVVYDEVVVDCTAPAASDTNQPKEDRE